MDRTEWFLGVIVYLLAALVLEVGTGGFLLFELSIVLILWAQAAYLLTWLAYELFQHT